MIVPQDYWTKNTSKILERSYNYLLVDISHLEDTDFQKPYEYLLELAKFRNGVEMLNSFWRKAGIDRNLDTSVFSFITDAIYSEEPFTPEHLETYFNMLKEFESGVNLFQGFGGMFDDVYLDNKIEMVILGISFRKQQDLHNSGTYSQFSTGLFKLKYEYLDGEISYKTFKQKADKMISAILNSLNKKAA